MKNIILLFILMPLYALNISAKNSNLKKQLIKLNQNWEQVNIDALDKDYNYTNEVDLIKLHLSLVEDELRRNTPSNLSAIKKQNRIKCLDILNKYWNNGVFPKNTFHKERTPYFIDIYGTYCAVGYLIKETGFVDVAQKIHQENNYGYINDLKKEYKEIDTWANEYGFTTDELAWIQPTYGNPNTITYTNFSNDDSIRIKKVCYLNDGMIQVPNPTTWCAQPPVTATISSFSSFANQTSLSAGSYTITVIDANSSSKWYNIYLNDSIVVSNSVLTTSCSPVQLNRLVIDSVTGVSPFTYSLVGGNISVTQTTDTFFNLVNGPYNLNVTDANGCVNSTFNYIPISTLNIYPYTSTISPTCLNNCGGKITIDSAFSATLPISYFKNVGGNWIQSNQNYFDSLCVGNHQFKIVDSIGCSYIFTRNIQMGKSNSLFQATISSPTPLCYGSNVPISVNITGGQIPYTSTINNQFDNTFKIKIIDSLGCIFDTIYNANGPQNITIIDSIISPIICNGDSMTVQLSAIGGTPPYYGIGNMKLYNGFYSFNISDANGCTKNKNFYIIQPEPLSISSTITNPILCYSDTATLLIKACGGVKPYSGTGLFNKPAGIHSFSIQDSLGCIYTDGLYIYSPPLLSCITTITNPILCNGDSAGIQVSGIGGTLPYIGVGSFNIAAGTQLISITDSNGCVQDTLLNVNQPQLLSCIATITNPILCNGDSATIQVNANGGTMPYTGIGSFSSSTGTYTFVIADSNNCITDTSLTISSPSSILSSALGYSDNGTGNGSAKCIASGGTPPYTFFWSNSSISDSIANLSSGMYYVTITDANMCQMHDSVFVPLVFPAGIENSSSFNFAVYPNPSHGAFSIQFDHVIQAAAFEIVNLLGEKIYEQKISTQQKETIQFDAPLGMYILKIKIAGREYTQKITKF